MDYIFYKSSFWEHGNEKKNFSTLRKLKKSIVRLVLTQELLSTLRSLVRKITRVLLPPTDRWFPNQVYLPEFQTKTLIHFFSLLLIYG